MDENKAVLRALNSNIVYDNEKNKWVHRRLVGMSYSISILVENIEDAVKMIQNQFGMPHGTEFVVTQGAFEQNIIKA